MGQSRPLRLFKNIETDLCSRPIMSNKQCISHQYSAKKISKYKLPETTVSYDIIQYLVHFWLTRVYLIICTNNGDTICKGFGATFVRDIAAGSCGNKKLVIDRIK